jgi:hypothetical protein
MADDPVQWDDPVMAAIAKLGDDLRGDFTQLRADLMGRMDRLQVSLDAIHEDLTAIERMVGLYYRR